MRTVRSTNPRTITAAENTFSKEVYATCGADIFGKLSTNFLKREEHVWHSSKATSFHIDKSEWNWKKRRLNLYKSILERWKDTVPSTWIQGKDEEITESDVFCQRCYIKLSNYTGSFHVHHMYEEDGNGTAKGGWQHQFKLEEQFMSGVPLYVTCEDCHAAHHQRSLWEELDL